MGDCQNYGPFLGRYYNTGPHTGPNLGDPKRDHNFDNPLNVYTYICISLNPKMVTIKLRTVKSSERFLESPDQCTAFNSFHAPRRGLANGTPTRTKRTWAHMRAAGGYIFLKVICLLICEVRGRMPYSHVPVHGVGFVANSRRGSA